MVHEAYRDRCTSRNVAAGQACRTDEQTRDKRFDAGSGPRFVLRSSPARRPAVSGNRMVGFVGWCERLRHGIHENSLKFICKHPAASLT